MTGKTVALLAGLSLAAALAWQGRAVAADATTDLLHQKGLTRLGESWWVLPLELELRGKLAELPKRREHLVTAEKDLDGLIERNKRAWDDSRPAVSALKQTLARMSSADPQRELIDRQIASLVAGAREPRQLGRRSDVRSLVIEFAGERCAILATIVWVRDTVPLLHDRYLELRSDSALNEALQGLGRDHKLGPRRSYKAELERLHELEKLAATAWLPTYQQSGATRFTALINESAAATFSWSTDSEQPLLLTASTAEAIGIRPTADAVHETISIGPNREIAATRVTLGYLRLGKWVLRGERAYVLPPEAEDVGNRLGRATLGSRRVRFEPERLRMWLDEW
jgi:hypothetical protein